MQSGDGPPAPPRPRSPLPAAAEVFVPSGPGRALEISAALEDRLLRRAWVAAGSGVPVDRVAEHYVQMLLSEGAVPELAGYEIVPGTLRPNTRQGADLLAIPRAGAAGGPVVIEIKDVFRQLEVGLSRLERDLYLRSMGTLQPQVSPMGAAQDFARFSENNGSTVQGWRQQRRLAAGWVDRDWVLGPQGQRYFRDVRTRYLFVTSPTGAASLSEGVRELLHLGARQVIRVRLPRVPRG
jgi:hypothetical protein